MVYVASFALLVQQRQQQQYVLSSCQQVQPSVAHPVDSHLEAFSTQKPADALWFCTFSVCLVPLAWFAGRCSQAGKLQGDQTKQRIAEREAAAPRQHIMAGSSKLQPHQQQQQQQQRLRRQRRPQPSLLLLLLLAVAACGQLAAHVSAQESGDAHTALIVRFTADDGLATSSLPPSAAAAVAAAAVSPAAAAEAATAAVAARGGDIPEQQRVSGMAAAAAAAAPRIAALTASLTSTAEALGFRVVLSTPIATVFQGTVLTIAAEEGDVQTLKQRLQQEPSVEMVWVAVSDTL
jgi:hypothetical protein